MDAACALTNKHSASANMLYSVLVLCLFFMGSCYAQLSYQYYANSCPTAESLVKQAVRDAMSTNPGIAGGLLRLHFHDCFVNGCDGSVLIDSTSDIISEKEARGNKNSLRGFEVIDDAKSRVEAACPGVVSCADIVAFAARDSVVLAGGPSWTLRSGRRDGTVSSDTVANDNLPSFNSNLANLTQKFASKGLSQEEMVILSGGHSIGFSHCSSFISRLYNFSTAFNTDPSLNSHLAKKLKKSCPPNFNTSLLVGMDESFTKFDNKYYIGLTHNKGLFTSDAALLTDDLTANLVQRNTNKKVFFKNFAYAMIKMSEIDVKTGQDGQIRKNCRVINST